MDHWFIDRLIYCIFVCMFFAFFSSSWFPRISSSAYHIIVKQVKKGWFNCACWMVGCTVILSDFSISSWKFCMFLVSYPPWDSNSPWKLVVGRRSFPFGFGPIFTGELLVPRRVTSIIRSGRFDGIDMFLVVAQLSNEKYPSCLGYIGDYTTQLYGDYNKPL